MKSVSIYQTLEDRGNYEEIEEHGPYLCSLKDSNGNYKTGARIPWLGEGYYFWDNSVDDAHWWGETAYSNFGKAYLICRTYFDLHSSLLFDTVSEPRLLEELLRCANVIKRELKLENVTVPLVLGYLRKSPDFTYKAIRVCPYPLEYRPKIRINFPGNLFVLAKKEKIQICFFDRTLLTEPFEIVYPPQVIDDFAI